MQRGNRASIYALEIGIYARLRLFLWDLVGGARQRPHLAVLAAAPQHLVSGCFCCQMVLCWPIPFPPDLLGISSSAPLHETTKTQENTAHSTQATAHFVRMTVALRVRACREVETHTNHTRCGGQLVHHGLNGSKMTAHGLAPAISFCFVRGSHDVTSKEQNDVATQKDSKPGACCSSTTATARANDSHKKATRGKPSPRPRSPSCGGISSPSIALRDAAGVY